MAVTEDKASGNWRLWHYFHAWNENKGRRYSVRWMRKGYEAQWSPQGFIQIWLKNDSSYNTSLLSFLIVAHSAASVFLNASTDHLNYSRLSHLAPPKAPKAHHWLSVIQRMLVCFCAWVPVWAVFMHTIVCFSGFTYLMRAL